MATFALDTSSKRSFLALKKDTEIFSLASQGEDSHAESLSSLFDELVSSAGINVSEINSIIFGAGPGSFTGLRIGLSFLKGLALSLEVPVVKISSLAAIAWSFRIHSGDIYVLSDARRSEFFVESYSFLLNQIQSSKKAQILSVLELEEISIKNKGALIVSLDAELALGCKTLAAEVNVAQSMLELFEYNSEVFASEQNLCTFDLNKLASLEPNYVRAVAAKKITERG